MSDPDREPPAPQSSRRGFLLGRAAADAAVRATGLDRPPDSAAPSPPSTCLLEVSRRAMACEFHVFFNAGQYENATEAGLEALDLLEPLEKQLSFFRATSEISRINRLAAAEPVEVEPGLFALLETSLRISHQTDGAFDITAAPLWQVWGFSRRAGRLPSEDEIEEARRRVGHQLVELDPERRIVRFRKPGVELNLGSIGKGFALDRCGERLEAAGIADFLFHGGLSSLLARGERLDDRPIPLSSSPRGADSRGWSVGVAHPLRPGVRLAELRLVDRALATSGSGVQFFRHQGQRYGHILDPRTGHPAEGTLSVTVLAPTAAEADALSTALFVLGPREAADVCRRRADLSAVLITPAEHGRGVELTAIGLDDADLRRCSDW